MGFADADALMENISSAAHAIEWATERFWRRVDRLIRSGGRPPSKARCHSSTVSWWSTAKRRSPGRRRRRAVVRVALRCQPPRTPGRPLGGRSLRMLASRGAPPGEPWTERTYRAFVSLLGSGAAVVPTVEALERYDLFSRYLPEWRSVRSKPQRNAFHTFTVDRHLLQTVANANAFVRDVARPDLLLVGALLHDIGKGYPGDHTEVGVQLIGSIGERMGCRPRTSTSSVRSSSTICCCPRRPPAATCPTHAPRRTSPTAVGNQLRLDLLRALTEADSLATGPAAWSDGRPH
jgi:[protein-PII] uridylyltransferase